MSVRASDAEREHVATALQRAAAEGRLSPEEAGERLAAASEAKYWDDLQRLVADLPLVPEESPRPRLLLWGVARFALFAIFALTFWGVWGVRLLLFPLAFMAVAILSRPWRYRRWRRFRGRRWGWAAAAGPGSRS